MQDITIYIKSVTKQVLKSEMHSDSTRTQLIPAALAGMVLATIVGSVVLMVVLCVVLMGCSPSAMLAIGLVAPTVVVE